ncbi:hypothetical protein Dimus_037459, partial [Dionaea muscipula]
RAIEQLAAVRSIKKNRPPFAYDHRRLRSRCLPSSYAATSSGHESQRLPRPYAAHHPSDMEEPYMRPTCDTDSDRCFEEADHTRDPTCGYYRGRSSNRRQIRKSADSSAQGSDVKIYLTACVHTTPVTGLMGDFKELRSALSKGDTPLPKFRIAAILE